jgi:hypothetical protein
MSIRSRLSHTRSRIANIIDPTHKNSLGVLTGREFLKYGGQRPMFQDWSRLIMNEEDKYTGVMFAAINKRANLVAQLALECLRTDATKTIMEQAKRKGETVVHPYLDVIDQSLNFTNYDFWFNTPTFIDLRGVAYLGVIRTVAPGRVGDVVDFELLNPYKVERVIKRTDGRIEVGGYREWIEGGYFRDWPSQQVIEIRRLNPFKPDEPYSMSDAGKDSQFTLKQAGDYTRHSLGSNANAPGIYSTDVILNDDNFQLFKARIKGTDKGEPIIANGAGAVNWQSTQIEMDKAALDKVNQVSLEHLLAVTSTSKTSLGIEQSGVTRDTSKVMRDQLTSDAGIPLLTFIIEALNQDYKRYYSAEYAKNQYRLFIDSPLKTDREAEGKDIENRKAGAELYQTMIDKGYDRKTAAKYAAGEVSLEDIGEPKNEPKPAQLKPPEPPPPPNDDPAPEPKNKIEINQLAATDVSQLSSQEASLQNTIAQVEEQLALAVINKVDKNVYDETSEVIAEKDRKEQDRQLTNALLVFYSLVVPLQAKQVMQQRSQQYGKPGTFAVDATVRQAIDQASTKAADSHIETILEDLRQTVKQTMIAEGDISRIAEAVAKKYPDVTAEQLKASVREAAKGGKSDSEIAQALRAKYKDADFEDLLAGVREAALKGAEHDQLLKAIRQEYAHISQTRAKVIAKTETNRAFSMSQYQADRQFLDQNSWTGQAYKKWVTHSPNPCPFCQAKAAEPAIPFDVPFANIGDTVTAHTQAEDGTVTVRAYPVTYETVVAGSLHPNCSCSYELIIRDL